MSPSPSFARSSLSIRILGAAFVLAAILPSSIFAGAPGAPTASTPDRTLVGACAIGETNPPSTSFNVLDLKDLVVYQLLDPAECAACGGGPVVLDQVRWQIRYYSTLCPITFEVSVVASDHGACPRPDTTNVLCPAFTFVYTASGPAPHIDTIPFPPGCCLTGQAFVRVHIVDTDGCHPGQLGFFARGPYNPPCRSYASFPGYPLDDSTNLIGAVPTVAVDADCCNPTPARSRTWGEVKIRYR